MIVNVVGNVNVEVLKRIELHKDEIEGLSKEEIEELALDKAYEELTSLDGYVGNGGYDKLIGVAGDGESIYADSEIEYSHAEWEE